MDAEVYDTITADQIEYGDQIVVRGDYIEVSTLDDDMENVIVAGYSHITGDTERYEIPFTETVDLWSL